MEKATSASGYIPWYNLRNNKEQHKVRFYSHAEFYISFVKMRPKISTIDLNIHLKWSSVLPISLYPHPLVSTFCITKNEKLELEFTFTAC